jgi:hypothetical protein
MSMGICWSEPEDNGEPGNTKGWIITLPLTIYHFTITIDFTITLFVLKVMVLPFNFSLYVFFFYYSIIWFAFIKPFCF